MGTPGGTPDVAAAPEDTSGAALSSATEVVGEVVGRFVNLSCAAALGPDAPGCAGAVGPKLVGTPGLDDSADADADAVGVVEVGACNVSACLARRLLGHTSSVGSQQPK